jgi:hypothetical protein
MSGTGTPFVGHIRIDQPLETVDERVSARGCRQEAVDKMLSPSFAAGALCSVCQQLREHGNPAATLKALFVGVERLGR